MKNAYFAGGCFWCITPMFRNLPGVTGVVSGYSGGDTDSPTYTEVKSQTTGHRETVKITYDPEKTDYTALLELFISSVDPFDDGGQFIDRGFSYTLAVFYTDDAEKTAAENRLSALARDTGRVPAVSVLPFRNFFDAEEYHQDYDLKNPSEFAEELEKSGRKKA
ncbi:MAG: peptide-methionine (S)-S-oxide reductase MsrA [Clostridia bacterium]|nr:peptide-methionine (S)-S-oxide reductase MsrA [Clostridia bacterium]